MIDDNLRHAFPEWTPRQRAALCRRMWEHLFLMVVEMAHAPRKIHDTNWRDYCRLAKPDLMMRTLFDERPTVCLSGHYGNFELSSYVLGLLGFHVYAIARPLDNVYLDRYVTRFREASGQHIIPKDGSAPLIDALMARGGSLGFLIDQHAGPKGCYVNFFGAQRPRTRRSRCLPLATAPRCWWALDAAGAKRLRSKSAAARWPIRALCPPRKRPCRP